MSVILTSNLGFVTHSGRNTVTAYGDRRWFNVGPLPIVLLQTSEKFASISDPLEPILYLQKDAVIASVHRNVHRWHLINNKREIKKILKRCNVPMLPTDHSHVRFCQIRIPRSMLLKTKRNIVEISDAFSENDMFLEILDTGDGEYFEGFVIYEIRNCRAFNWILKRHTGFCTFSSLFNFDGNMSERSVVSYVKNKVNYNSELALKRASAKFGIKLELESAIAMELRKHSNAKFVTYTI